MSVLRASGRALVGWAGSLLSMPIALAFFVAWLLRVGPVPVPFLPAYVEQAANAAGLTARIGRAYLTLEGAGPGIRLAGIRAGDVGDAFSVGADNVSIELDLPALAAGRLRPDVIELDRPSLALKRREIEDFSGIRHSLDTVLQRSADGSAATLPPITITDGEIQVLEAQAGPSLRIARINGKLEGGTVEFKASLSGQLDVGGSRAPFTLSGATRQDRPGVRLTLSVDGIDPGSVAALFPDLVFARGVRVPASGSATFDVSREGTLEAAAWDLTGSPGNVELPALVGTKYHVKDARLRGGYQDGTFHISAFSVAIGAAKLSGEGQVALGQPGSVNVSLEASATDIAVDHLGDLWPQSLYPPVRAWVTTHLHGGKVQTAKVAFALSRRRGAPGASLERLSGEMKMTGLTVDYLQGMPAARDVVASARFDTSAFRITLLDGVVNDLRIERGEIDIGRFGRRAPAVRVDLHGRGAAASALRLMTYEPLGQSPPVGIDLDRLDGDAEVHVSLDFDLPERDDGSSRDSLRWQAVLGAERLDYGEWSPWVERLDVDARGGAGKVTTLKIGAEMLDARPFLALRQASSGPAAPLDLELAIGRMRMENGRELRNLRGNLTHEDGLWQDVDVEVGHGSPQQAVLQVKSRDDRRREVRASAKDTGQLLAALGIYVWMVGGETTLTGRVEPGGTMRGQISVRDYRIVNAPTMAKLLEAASLAGILDALRGKGLAFARLKSDFVVEGGRITLVNLRAFGASLGLTANGTVNAATGEIDIDGTLAPAYTISRIVKLIPLLGSRLAGKDEGLLAFTFGVSGRLSNPHVSLNPLSILVPSVLRQLVIAGTVDEPEAAAAAQAAPQ